MSSERWQRLRAVYDAIADAPPADRNRLLDELCGEDAALRAEVEAMLAADETPHAWLDDSLAAFIAGAFRPGDVLCERFELMRVAGRGGMGEVWAAHDRKLGHDIALKTIAATFMTGEQALARFTQEVKLARRVNHRNVCRVHDLLEDCSGPAPRVFLTMELLEGQTLGALLARDGRLPADSVALDLSRAARGALRGACRRRGAPRPQAGQRDARAGRGVAARRDHGLRPGANYGAGSTRRAARRAHTRRSARPSTWPRSS